MQLEPYLFFKGNCEEALNFYKDIFGGEIEGLSRWEEMPEGTEGPQVTPETANRVMHASFRAPGIAFMASDATPGKTYGEGPMSMSLGTSDVAEAERVFNRLGEGGNVEMPLTDMFWGAKFGMLTDKFGIDWMINCSTAQQ
ncbi:MAG: VOC family protein [Candidatus Eremiobacteraeota bacterium]|nr:VOC family protein [Candidatus Eremiobacteraeota bacterium]